LTLRARRNSPKLSKRYASKLSMMILILLTREDEHNERGQNAQNKHDDRDRKGGTLVVERALRESICFFVCAWKECGFCSICVCFSEVLQVCVVENLKGKVSLSLSLCLI